MIGDGMPLVEIVTAGEKRPALPAVAPLPPNPRLPDAIRLQNATRKDVTHQGRSKGAKRPLDHQRGGWANHRVRRSSR